VRALGDRVVRLIARLAAVGWFRSIEVSGLERVSWDGPVLVVANHHGGFVDPAVLAATLPRMPRFLAMARLWKLLPLRPLLALAGAIPVQRSVDGTTGRNVHPFAAADGVLRGGGIVGIFPEGQASDLPHLLPVKTGAARIALGARAAGASGIRIVPVGVMYERKQTARSRAYVRVGVPIDLDRAAPALLTPGGPTGADDREGVRALTEEIESRLAEASLDFEDAAEAADLWFAAAVSLRRRGGSPSWAPRLSDLEGRAQRLSSLPAAEVTRIRAASNDYRHALEVNVTDDRAVAAGPRGGVGAARIAGGVLTVVALPFAAVGLVVNALPALAVNVAGRRKAEPVTLATIKFLVGLVAFPLTWIALRYLILDETSEPWLWTVVLGPGCGLVTAVTADRIRRIRLARLRPARLVVPTRVADDLLERRAWLVETVGRALGHAGGAAVDASSRDGAPDAP
jgi:1-acyl-sn-glycerol-3-phosphate acyltransferase